MTAKLFKLTHLLTATAILAGSLAATDIASARDGGGPARSYSGTVEIGDQPAAAPRKKETKKASKPTKKRNSLDDTAKIIQMGGAPRRVGLSVIGGLVGDFSCTVVWCIFDKGFGMDTRYTPGDVTRQVLGGKPAKRARRVKQKVEHDKANCQQCQREAEGERRLAAWRAAQKAKRDAAMKYWREKAQKREELHRRHGSNGYTRFGGDYQMRLGR
ncbi:MAG: hypothetical protein ABJG86_21125 [Nitratireductor sp.]